MSTGISEPLYSRLGGDKDLGDIVTMFVDEMPDRLATLTATLETGDLESVGRTAHQLKGAAGSYGFDEITPFAAQLEAAVRDGGTEEAIRQAADELIGICQRVRDGAPQ